MERNQEVIQTSFVKVHEIRIKIRKVDIVVKKKKKIFMKC